MPNYKIQLLSDIQTTYIELGVTKDVPPYTLVYGSTVRSYDYVFECGTKPNQFKREISGVEYLMLNNNCVRKIASDSIYRVARITA